MGPFEDSPYRGRELLIWGKERRSFDALYKPYKIHKPYKIYGPYKIHKPHKIHKIHKSYHRKRVPGRHFSALYFPI